jgi:outer membrane protein assembly factor BamB
MSTDTDYIITIKGKDAALRKAAADYIELLLQPWGPQRDDKKTLTRMNVFRNESNARGLLAPSSLCEDAAKLFPGTDISFESKNEYGNAEEGQWNEDGEAPKDANEALAVKALERIQREVESIPNRIDWLNPLILWASTHKIPKKTLDQIGDALEEAEKAKNEALAAQEAEADKLIDASIQGEGFLESATRWSFHPVFAAKTRLVGRLGASLLCQPKTFLDKKHNTSHQVWTPSPSANEGAALEDNCEMCIGSPILPDSKEGEMFLASQVYKPWPEDLAGPRIFVRTAKGLRVIGAHIQQKDSFLWIHSKSFLSEPKNKRDLRNSLRLSKLLENAAVGEVLHREDLSADKKSFGQSLSNFLVASGSQIFVASNNSQPEGQGMGRFFALSLSDGTVVWTSELRFHECNALLVSDAKTLLAVVTIDEATALVCLEAATGKERWRTALNKTGRVRFQLAASDETLVLLSYESEKATASWGKINSGKLFIEKEFSDEDLTCPDLVIDGTQVYLGFKDMVKAYGHEGEDVWTAHLPKAEKWTRCKIILNGKGGVLVCRGSSGVTCLAGETGAVIWAAQEGRIRDCLVGAKDRAFFTTDNAYMARNATDGSILWASKHSQAEDYSREPVAVTDRVFVGIAHNRETSERRLEWFDVETGSSLGSTGLSGSSDFIMTKDGALLCIAHFWAPTFHHAGGVSTPEQLICFDLKIGTPQGPWPMSRQGEGCAAFLPSSEKSGYKQFVEAWKAKEDLSPRLTRLGAPSGDEGDKIARIHGIIRGHEMVSQAKLWAEPTIGPGKTAPARGRQWRLVMAYGGLELLVKSLSATKGNGLDEKILSDLFGKLALPPFEALKAPSPEKSSLKEWIEEEDASDVLDFLRMGNGDRARFDTWLTKQQPVESWVEGVLLAKALRSATVHGALSPTKVMEWKLNETFTRLTEDILRIDEAFFESLGRKT